MKQFRLSVLLSLTLLGAALTHQPAAAATVVVTTSADSGAGSLRDAISNANPGNRITFDNALTGQTISLISDLPTVNQPLILDGELHNITISGSSVARSGLTIDALGNVTVRNLTFINGSSSSQGGAFNVLQGGYLSVHGSIFTSNMADYGGAIYVAGDSIFKNKGGLQIVDSQFVNNQVDWSGGAIFLGSSATADIGHSTFSGNFASSNGGALYLSNVESLTIARSTFDNNTSERGGAIYNFSFFDSDVLIENSTFKNNFITGSGFWSGAGGALYNDGTDDIPMLIRNSTFSGNSANTSNGIAIYNKGYLELSHVTISASETSGDAVAAYYEDGRGLIRHSIIANTIGTTDCAASEDVENYPSIQYSLIETPGGSCSAMPISGNITAVDPQLGTLSSMNSFTEVFPLKSASVAINAGFDSLCTTTDQRAIYRSDGQCDMGAYEANASDRCFATPDNGVTVFSSADLSTGNVIADAIAAAGTNATVKLAGLCLAASPGNPVLLPQVASINKNLTLQGGFAVGDWLAAPDSADFPTIIDGGAKARIISISGNSSVALRDLTLQHGQISSSGAAINVSGSGTLTLRNVQVRHNYSTGAAAVGAGLYNSATANIVIIDSVFAGNRAANGAALHNAGGTVLIESTTFAHQYASNHGGAIYHAGGSLSAETSTFFNNAARKNGGAIFAAADVDMINSTLSGNAANVGGGININAAAADATLTNLTLHNNGAAASSGSALHSIGSATVQNSILSGGLSSADCVSTGTLALSYSLVEDGSCNAAAGTGNITDAPNLLGLHYQGGLTRVHRPRPNSAALNSGSNAVCPDADQRGTLREYGDCDMGAVELDVVPTAVGLSEQVAGPHKHVGHSLLALTLMTLWLTFRPKSPSHTTP